MINKKYILISDPMKLRHYDTALLENTKTREKEDLSMNQAACDTLTYSDIAICKLSKARSRTPVTGNWFAGAW